MLNILDCEQRSPEWYAVRDLKLTGSEANTIQANGGGLETYVKRLVYEYDLFTKYGAREETYISFDMQRGIDEEPAAISLYELESNVVVIPVGFVIHGKHSGVSPDGFVGEDGLVEAKCPNIKNHYKILETEIIDKKYIDQMQMQMMCCGKKWCDFISYNKNFGANSLFKKRILPDFDMYAKLGRGIKTGTELIKQLTGE